MVQDPETELQVQYTCRIYRCLGWDEHPTMVGGFHPLSRISSAVHTLRAGQYVMYDTPQ
jgi:hypothetical protein